MFFKSKRENTKKEFIIPSEHVRDILVLREAYTLSESAVDKYDLWAAIEKIFPEVKVGGWSIIYQNATTLIIREI